MEPQLQELGHQNELLLGAGRNCWSAQFHPGHFGPGTGTELSFQIGKSVDIAVGNWKDKRKGSESGIERTQKSFTSKKAFF